jgi:protein-disulfide isomerase
MSKTTKPPARRRGQKIAARRGRRNTSWQLWVGVAVLIVAVVAGVAIQSGRTSTGGSVTRPAHALGPDGGEQRGSAAAPVVVQEYGDFQCPHCADFQRTVGSTIDKLVDQGKIRFVFNTIAFIGPESTAAGSAATAAGDQGKFWQYHDQLFAQQGPENSGTFSTSKLLAIGRQVGLDNQRFTNAVEQGTYKGWIGQQTDNASRQGVNQTPTVMVDGQVAPDAITPQGLAAAVTAALAAK